MVLMARSDNSQTTEDTSPHCENQKSTASIAKSICRCLSFDDDSKLKMTI